MKDTEIDKKIEALMFAIDSYVRVKIDEAIASSKVDPDDSMGGYSFFNQVNGCYKDLKEAIENILK